LTFLRGAAAPVRGLAWLLRHPRVWPWALLPSAIGIAAAAVAYAVWLAHVDDIMAGITRVGWIQTAGKVAGVLLGFALAVLAYFVACSVAAGPFNEMLAESVGKIAFGRQPPPRTRAWPLEIAVSIGHEAAKLGVFLAAQALGLACCLVPGIGGGAHAVYAALVTAAYLGTDYHDYAMSVERMRLREKIGYLRAHAGAVLGFGAVCMLWLAVPAVNLLLHPAAVAGAALAFAEQAGTPSPVPSK
jgi:uncharacterized protein involved in cysteine biosynthesis